MGEICNEWEGEEIKKQETSLQSRIIAALCAKGCYAVNHTVGKFYTEYGAVVKIGVPGQSDVWGHRGTDGKAFYVEVKLPGETPEPEQLDFIAAMKNTGAIAGWCTSVDGALEIVFGGT